MQLGETTPNLPFPENSHFSPENKPVVSPQKFGTEVITLPSFFMRIFKACQPFPSQVLKGQPHLFCQRFPTFPLRLPVSDRSMQHVLRGSPKVGIPSATRSVRNATGRSWNVAKSCTCHGMPGSPFEPSGGGVTWGNTVGVSPAECLGNGCGRGRCCWSWEFCLFKCGSWWFGWMAGYIDLRFF